MSRLKSNNTFDGVRVFDRVFWRLLNRMAAVCRMVETITFGDGLIAERRPGGLHVGLERDWGEPFVARRTGEPSAGNYNLKQLRRNSADTDWEDYPTGVVLTSGGGSGGNVIDATAQEINGAEGLPTGDSSAPVIVFPVADADGKPRYVFALTDSILPATLTKDGGHLGGWRADGATDTFQTTTTTYTVKDKTGTTTLATGVTPEPRESGRNWPAEGAKIIAATVGLVYYDSNGALKLIWCDEAFDTIKVTPITSLQVDTANNDLELKRTPMLVFDEGAEDTNWTTWHSGTDCA